jgi:hypothetical protein
MPRGSPPKAETEAGRVKPLSGGNPQIAKGDGDAPTRAYIAAMPVWKSGIGRRIDEIIVREVPGVPKAVRWNSPFWGIQGNGCFLSLHCFTKYLKVTFLRGVSLDPPSPVESKHAGVRYFHITEEGFDETLFADWVRKAAALPGEKLFQGGFMS